MKRVFVTAKAHDYLIDGLKKNGYEVLYQPTITYEELAASVKDIDGLDRNHES